MKKASFRFLPDIYFGNKDLRLCSPAARAFWIDLLCLMCQSGGYLAHNGEPLADGDIAALTGLQKSDIKKWLIELGAHQIYSVDDRGWMYSSRMVKDAGFVKKAVAAGQRGQVNKKAKAQEKPVFVAASIEVPLQKTPKTRKQIEKALSRDPTADREEVKKVADLIVRQNAAAKPWWETPAGWATAGQKQAISKTADESVDEFKYRVAKRLGTGPHMAGLAPEYRARLEKEIEADAERMKSA